MKKPTRDWLWSIPFLFAGALYLWTRVAPLDQGLWHDEAFTVTRFLAGGPVRILSPPWLPNNHILFNLLAWLTTRVFGTTEIALRFWSVVPATAGLIWLTVWLFRRGQRVAASVFAVLATISPLLYELSIQARGYGLTFLAICAFLIAGLEYLEGGGRRWLIVLSLASIVGVASLPVFVLPVVCGGIVLLVAERKRARDVVLALGASGTATALVYLAVFRDLLNQSGQEFGETLAPHGVVWGPFRDQLRPLGDVFMHHRWWEHGGPNTLPILVSIVAIVGGLGVRQLARKGWGRPLFLLAPIFGTYFGFWVARFYILPRFASYLVIPMLVLIAIGVEALVALPSRRTWQVVAATLIVALLGFESIQFAVLSRTFLSMPEESFKRVAGFVRGFRESGYVVYGRSDRLVGLRYYVAPLHRVETQARMDHLCASDEPIVFIDHRFSDREFDISCLAARGAEKHHFRQRRRGSIDVWVWPPPEPAAPEEDQ